MLIYTNEIWGRMKIQRKALNWNFHWERKSQVNKIVGLHLNGSFPLIRPTRGKTGRQGGNFFTALFFYLQLTMLILQNLLQDMKRIKFTSINIKQWKFRWVNLHIRNGGCKYKIVGHIMYFKLVFWCYVSWKPRKENDHVHIYQVPIFWLKKAK